VLLETAIGLDSGHPTGAASRSRIALPSRATYFNFSTSGQWLWDELQVVLRPGQDPIPSSMRYKKKVAEATAESAKQAEQEWQHAARSRDMRSLSAAPAINVKPVIGGIEIAVRYVTRANERLPVARQAQSSGRGPARTEGRAASDENKPEFSRFRLLRLSR